MITIFHELCGPHTTHILGFARNEILYNMWSCLHTAQSAHLRIHKLFALAQYWWVHSAHSTHTPSPLQCPHVPCKLQSLSCLCWEFVLLIALKSHTVCILAIGTTYIWIYMSATLKLRVCWLEQVACFEPGIFYLTKIPVPAEHTLTLNRKHGLCALYVCLALMCT